MNKNENASITEKKTKIGKTRWYPQRFANSNKKREMGLPQCSPMSLNGI